jgi:hypothetical protein
MEINGAKDLIASEVTRSKKFDLNSINTLPLNKGTVAQGGSKSNLKTTMMNYYLITIMRRVL